MSSFEPGLTVSLPLSIFAPAPAPVHLYTYLAPAGAPWPSTVTTSGLQKGSNVSLSIVSPLYVALMMGAQVLALPVAEKLTV